MQPPADPFETRLECLFADPPPAPDAEAFAMRLERRIVEESRRRRLVYAVCAGGAAVIAILIFLAGGAPRETDEVLRPIVFFVDASWLGAVGQGLVAAALIWVIAELAPNPYRR